jgi:hypothetical protein
MQSFPLLARDERGAMAGGLIGSMYYGWLRANANRTSVAQNRATPASQARPVMTANIDRS